MRFLLFLTTALCAVQAAAQAWAWDDGTTPFVVSPPEVVDRMLYLAAPKKGERLIDLGSGDGRIVIEAARRFGAQGLGVDIDPQLVALARERAAAAGVGELARFEVRDLFETDLRGASVVTMYLLPEVNQKLLPRLREQLRPGARIVSHDYALGDWPFDEMIEIALPDKPVGPLGRSRIYLWVVPEDARGSWSAEIPGHGGRWRFDIRQKYQELDVEVRQPSGELLVRGARLRGEDIRVIVTGMVGRKAWHHVFAGRVTGGRIEGELRVSDGEQVRVHPWKASRLP